MMGTRTVQQDTAAVQDSPLDAFRARVRPTPKRKRSTGFDPRSIVQTELLTPKEELALSRQVQKLVQWEGRKAQIEEVLERNATDVEWAEAVGVSRAAVESGAFAHAIDVGEKARKHMVSSNVRLVISIAKRYRNKGMDFQDLIQEGIFGLSRAVDKFDPERGFKFSTYATWWIRQTVLRGIADQSRIIRLPVHIHDQIQSVKKATRDLRSEGVEPSEEKVSGKMGITEQRIEFLKRCEHKIISIDDQMKGGSSKGSGAGSGGQDAAATSRLSDVIADDKPTPVETADQHFLQVNVDDLLKASLSEREITVVTLRFGLQDGHPRTLEQIGRNFQITRERVRQIEARALHKLRQPYRNHKLEAYANPQPSKGDKRQSIRHL